MPSIADVVDASNAPDARQAPRPAGVPLLSVTDLVVEFPASKNRTVKAVSGVSFDVARGEALGLVGESGCGKSTTGRAILQMPRPKSGSIVFDGEELTGLPDAALRRVRTRMQMIFQDPIASLNPRRSIGDLVREPLRVWRPESKAEHWTIVDEMLTAVGIDPAAKDKKAHQFSGGQCQRIAIARALILQPELVVCDEPISALDVSIQAQILNMLEDLKAELGLTLVFIAHDLAAVKSISDRIAVMYLGKICEISESDELFARPAHPYTRLLLDSSPTPDPDLPVTDLDIPTTDMPSPLNPPSGCRFRTRCPRADDTCATVEPQPVSIGAQHVVACHHPLW
jgi:peptide/nickel transport system ATP-binding protein